jgi:hypothetical protein
LRFETFGFRVAHLPDDPARPGHIVAMRQKDVRNPAHPFEAVDQGWKQVGL